MFKILILLLQASVVRSSQVLTATKSIIKKPDSSIGQIALFLEQQAAKPAISQERHNASQLALQSFLSQQEDPLYQKAMSLLNDKKNLSVYEQALSSLQMFFFQYSQEHLQHFHAKSSKSPVVFSSVNPSMSFESVLAPYEQALQILIKEHQAHNPSDSIEFVESNVIFSTYHRIIGLYVSYLSGFSKIVGQEFARKFPYHDDLKALSGEFFTYETKVKNLASLFPSAQQDAVLDCFYGLLTDSVVQVCYQIIKETSYALSVENQDIASVYIAYNLAWAAQTKNMKLTGLARGADFSSSVTTLMVTLLQNAVLKRTHSIEFESQEAEKSNDFMKEIEAYQKMLFQVYTNAGQKDQASKQLLAMKNIRSQLTQAQKYAKDFGTAKKLPTVAQVIAKQGATPPVSQAALDASQTQASVSFAQAQAAEKKGDFAQAMKQYGISQGAYLQLLSAPSLAAQAEQNKYRYFLAKTRWTASSLASTVLFLKSTKMGTLTGVPVSYFIDVYEPSIDFSLLAASIMPQSLSVIPLSQYQATLTEGQIADVLQVFKAFLVSQILSDQSTDFASCFQDYTLVKKAGLSFVSASIADHAIKKVDKYLATFPSSVVVGVELTSATAITIVFKQMPLPAVTPLYAAGICAGDYFVGARSLFAPGAELISLYGETYVPGDDSFAANMMLQNLAYAYSCAALEKIQHAKNQMAKILKEIEGKAPKKDFSYPSSSELIVGGSIISLPKDFAARYTKIKQDLVQSQSLLVAQGSSAQAYFKQAGLTSQAQAVQDEYISLYQTSIDFMKKCLVGDPTATQYNNLLLDINTAYLQWASQLDPKSDSAQRKQINQDIVNLFILAGDQCLKTSHQEAMYPGFKQIYYENAAQNFQAAQKQYKSMQDAKMVQAMEDKMKYAFVCACDQNMQLYFYVKNHGVSYTSSTTGQLIPITFKQLCLDYTNFEQVGMAIDSGEIHAYNKVQNLLLTSTMLYQYLASLTGAPDAVPVASTASNTGVAKAAKLVVLPDQKVLNYLIAQNVLSKTAVTIPYMQAGVKEKILQVTPAAYGHFAKDGAALTAWFNVLIQVVQNVYMQDYLGASATENSTQLTTHTKEFFDAVQKQASSMQNPSSAYVG